MRLALAIAPALLAASACPSLDPFACVDDEQCTLMAEGVCHEDRGACSYPDGECPSGQRWSQTAGALAGTCVDEEPATSGATMSGATSSASDTASSTDPLPQAECGNGVLEGDEECDVVDDDCDACTADCRIAGEVRWRVTHDEHGFGDYFDAAVVAPDGEVIVAGRTFTEPPAAQPENTEKDRIVVRYDAGGTLRWKVTELLVGTDDLSCVTLSPTGDVIAGGVRIMGSRSELWIGRYDEGGAEDLLTYYDYDPRQSEAQACAFIGDRLVVVGMIDDPEATAGYEHWDRLVIDDALGDPRALEIGGRAALTGRRDIAFRLAAAPEGGFVVGGNVTVEAEDGADRWVARFDAEGTWLMEYVDGGPGVAQEEVTGLLLHDDLVIAAGSDGVNVGGVEQPWAAGLTLDGLASTWLAPDPRLPTSAKITSMAWHESGVVLAIYDTDRGTPEVGHTALAALDPSSGECLWLVRDPADMRRTGDVAVAPDGSVVIVGADAPEDADDADALAAVLELPGMGS